jgi:hypothetical protein
MITKFILFETKDEDYSVYKNSTIYIDEDDDIDLIYSKNPKLNNYQFRLGDYVYNNIYIDYKNDIYQIVGIDTSDTDSAYPYRLLNIKTNEYNWGSKANLTLIPDYEIDAIKYNI